MKLKEGFVLREVAGSNVVIPTGNQLNTNMMITLNDTGCFLWKMLEQGATDEDLLNAMLAEYQVDEETAKAHIAAFCQKLSSNGFLD